MCNILKHNRRSTLLKQLNRPCIQRLLILCLSGPLIMLLGGAVLLTGPVAHAASVNQSLARADLTCAGQPSADHCDGQDPITQGCAFDTTTHRFPQTVARQNIQDHGQVVGRAEVRYSQRCNAYWARGFSYLAGKSVTVYLPALGTGDAASYLSDTAVAYSNMVYRLRPSITVMVIVDAGHTASVTLPATR